jgi:hypothetical protein
MMRLAPFALCLWCVWGGSAAWATTVLLLNMEGHLRDSTAVVDAQVGASIQIIDEETGRPFTTTELHVERLLWGEAPNRLGVRQMRGVVGDRVHRVAGDPELRPGDRVVAFVHRDTDGRWYLTALAQSLYRVVGDGDDAKVERQLGGLQMMAHDTQGRLQPLEKAPAEPSGLRDLERAIETAAAAL